MAIVIKLLSNTQTQSALSHTMKTASIREPLQQGLPLPSLGSPQQMRVLLKDTSSASGYLCAKAELSLLVLINWSYMPQQPP